MTTNSTPVIRPWVPPIATTNPANVAVPESENVTARQFVMELLKQVPATTPTGAYTAVTPRAGAHESAPHLGRYVDVTA